ncbi:ADP-ribosylation factor 1 (macronuclear) [Tetrahymena thermophila SB210]|uniref:ADP-ribosylation factor 1 n=1 Tax=Tetrahymena thermophila (strain SB210) TaxID=312017 RepID=Q23WV1_TETTS|nr:ADP-ribosylation factor 1 [Tetrahymena thermophila SB210]EAS00994.1 ADP-ribosylation factor 1 [Tetrahymena thermophila SB210]|eukprot:XP_001021239.1 ADP-ribosylation factor 1 [Tetrahymena thermophila SB210]
MGQIQDKISRINIKKRVKVFMAGNPSSGRTTILYKWKNQKIDFYIPTPGFNVERIVHNQIEFEMWEGGGGQIIRNMWADQMQGVEALIVVLDSSDLNQDQQYFQEQVQKLLARLPQKNLPFLILANKKDKYLASLQEIEQYVGIEKFKSQIQYKIIYTNPFTGEGLTDALDWLAQKFI